MQQIWSGRLLQNRPKPRAAHCHAEIFDHRTRHYPATAVGGISAATILSPPSTPVSANRWDLRGTGVCCGDKILLKIWRRISVFIGNYDGGIRSRRCRRPHTARWRALPQGTRGDRVGSWLLVSISPEASHISCCPKEIVLNRQVILTSVDIDFLRNQNKQKIGTHTGH